MEGSGPPLAGRPPTIGGGAPQRPPPPRTVQPPGAPPGAPVGRVHPETAQGPPPGVAAPPRVRPGVRPGVLAGVLLGDRQRRAARTGPGCGTAASHDGPASRGTARVASRPHPGIEWTRPRAAGVRRAADGCPRRRYPRCRCSEPIERSHPRRPLRRRPHAPPVPAAPPRQPAWRPAAALQTAPATSLAKIHPETVALGDVQALHALARQGAWRATLEKATAALQAPADVGGNGARPATNSPAWLCLKTFQVVALAKLRRHAEAADALNALGDLDDARYNTAPGGACATPTRCACSRRSCPTWRRRRRTAAAKRRAPPPRPPGTEPPLPTRATRWLSVVRLNSRARSRAATRMQCARGAVAAMPRCTRR